MGYSYCTLLPTSYFRLHHYYCFYCYSDLFPVSWCKWMGSLCIHLPFWCLRFLFVNNFRLTNFSITKVTADLPKCSLYY